MTKAAKIVSAICLISTALSLINPLDYGLWIFEIFAGLIALVLIFIYNKDYPLTNLLYGIITLHFIILATAAHYSYAEMPLFNWIRDEWHLSRNYFDRVGHFFQGVTPAILSREILLRGNTVRRGKMLAWICVCIPLAFSAFWEILEWLVAVSLYAESAQEWLGTQGDIFDAQGDMLMALCGACVALILFSKLHDKQLLQMSHN